MLEYVMLLLISFVNISLVAILIRLNLKHKEFFSQMEYGGIIYGSNNTLAKLVEFIVKRNYAKMNDPLLTGFCNLFICSFLISLPLMFITLLRFPSR